MQGSLLILLAWLLLLCFPAQGKEVGKRAKVAVCLEFIELSSERYHELMFMRRLDSDATGLRAELQKLLGEPDVAIRETAVLVSEQGKMTRIQSAREFIYPTEWEPPEFPHTVGVGSFPPVGEPSAATAMTPATPSAFSKKRLGLSVKLVTEVTRGVSGVPLVKMDLEPRLVYHTGDVVWSEWVGGLGKQSLKMPHFYVMHFKTTLLSRDGAYALVSVLSPKDGQGNADRERKVMAFVRCDVME